MFNPSAALFANTMLMFRLMFFYNKKPAESGILMLQCLFFRHISGRLVLTRALACSGVTHMAEL
ncbi:hypothetical protein C2U59_05695 [Klebsiella pneumoniae]|nr:hypothetical protein [Klebsiella pneumoniae]